MHKGLIYGPNGRPMSPSHSRRRGRIYRYYVTREAIADGYETFPVASVPAGDVEGAVLDHIRKLLAAPELVARTWATTKRNGEDEITEHEVTTPESREESAHRNHILAPSDAGMSASSLPG